MNIAYFSFPFVVGNQNFSECQTGFSPSYTNKRCAQFVKADKTLVMPVDFQSMMIKYNKGNNSTMCYRYFDVFSIGVYAWKIQLLPLPPCLQPPDKPKLV